ncbi:MAG: glycosyltransferase [Verrucomicrobiota bacterium]
MRILVITSSTGGGHDMRAQSFKAWANKLTDWEVRVHQALESTHFIYALGVEIYNWIQRFFPRLHHLYFNYLEIMGIHRQASQLIGAEKFKKLLLDFKPEVLVSTHAHLNHGFFEYAVETLGGPAHLRCVTISTEFFGGYGFSKHWVNPKADLFIGGVAETCKAAIKLGMQPEKIFCGGFLLRPKFFDKACTLAKKEEFLGQMDLSPSSFTLLLSTGAVGANNHIPILRALRQRDKPLQVIVLCGRDEARLNRVERWSDRPGKLKVKALGYWEDMPLLLQSVSATVTRPGAGTLSEAILTECPLIMNGIGGIMPQEWLNIKYGTKHGLIRVIRKPRDLCKILDNWERRPSDYQSIINNLKHQKPNAHPSQILAKAVGQEITLSKGCL